MTAVTFSILTDSKLVGLETAAINRGQKESGPRWLDLRHSAAVTLPLTDALLDITLHRGPMPNMMASQPNVHSIL